VSANRRIGYLVVTGLVVVALAGGTVALVHRSSAKPAPPVDRDFSAYVGVGNPAGLTSLATLLHHPMTFGTDCFDDRSWSGIDNDLWLINRWQGAGYPMVWCVPMLPVGQETTLAEGATGAYDEHFVHLARTLVAHGMGDSSLRIGWEFNNVAYPWYAAGQAPAFVAYWRHIVTALRSVPGGHFTIVWNPSRSSPSPATTAVGDLESYYPGDRYVDKVGIDVYDQAFLHYPGAEAQFQSIRTLPGGLDWIAGFGAVHRKPVVVPEFGLGRGASAPASGPLTQAGPVSGGDNPLFINDLFTWERAHHVDNLAYWDYGSSSVEYGQNPLTASALREQMARS